MNRKNLSQQYHEFKSDVIVIGGGVIGLCSALFLARSGRRVTLIESGELGKGCSEMNAGLVATSHVVPLAAPGVIGQGLRWLLDASSPFYIKPRFSFELIAWLLQFRSACNQQKVKQSIVVLHELLQASYALFEQLSTDAITDFDFCQRGLLLLYLTEKSLHHGVEEAETVRATGLHAELLDAKGIANLEPFCQITAAGGVHYPQDGHLHPGEFVDAIKKALVKLPVTIQTQTQVSGFETQAGRIAKVLTSAGVFSAEEVVLAGGSWSPGLAKMLPLKLLVQPGKGYSVALEKSRKQPSVPSILTEARVAVTPLANELRIAGTMALSGLNRSISQRRVAAMLQAVPRYYPEIKIENMPAREAFVGLRPCTPDGLPIVGRSRSISNLVVATGHAMLGVTLAPVTGKLVTELINSQTPSLDVAPLSPDRF